MTSTDPATQRDSGNARSLIQLTHHRSADTSATQTLNTTHDSHIPSSSQTRVAHDPSHPTGQMGGAAHASNSVITKDDASVTQSESGTAVNAPAECFAYAILPQRSPLSFIRTALPESPSTGWSQPFPITLHNPASAELTCDVDMNDNVNDLETIRPSGIDSASEVDAGLQVFSGTIVSPPTGSSAEPSSAYDVPITTSAPRTSSAFVSQDVKSSLGLSIGAVGSLPIARPLALPLALVEPLRESTPASDTDDEALEWSAEGGSRGVVTRRSHIPNRGNRGRRPVALKGRRAYSFTGPSIHLSAEEDEDEATSESAKEEPDEDYTGGDDDDIDKAPTRSTTTGNSGHRVGTRARTAATTDARSRDSSSGSSSSSFSPAADKTTALPHTPNTRRRQMSPAPVKFLAKQTKFRRANALCTSLYPVAPVPTTKQLGLGPLAPPPDMRGHESYLDLLTLPRYYLPCKLSGVEDTSTDDAQSCSPLFSGTVDHSSGTETEQGVQGVEADITKRGASEEEVEPTAKRQRQEIQIVDVARMPISTGDPTAAESHSRHPPSKAFRGPALQGRAVGTTLRDTQPTVQSRWHPAQAAVASLAQYPSRGNVHYRKRVHSPAPANPSSPPAATRPYSAFLLAR